MRFSSVLLAALLVLCISASVVLAATPNAALRQLKQQRRNVLQPTQEYTGSSSSSSSSSAVFDDKKVDPQTTQFINRAMMEMQYHSCGGGSSGEHARLCVHHEKEHSHVHSFIANGGEIGSQGHLDAKMKDVHQDIASAVNFVKAQANVQGSVTRRFLDSFQNRRTQTLQTRQINDFTYVIVGGGPGGLISALEAFAYGAQNIHVWDKRDTYVLNQLVAAGFLPYDALRTLNTDSTLPWYALGRKITNFFSDVSLKHVSIYLHAAVQVLAGAETANTPYNNNANIIRITMGMKLLGLCKVGNNDAKLSALGIAHDNQDNANDPFLGPSEADQLAYCNYIKGNNFINNGVWTVPLNHNGANTVVLQRLSNPSRTGVVVSGVNLITFADGSRSRLRTAFFGDQVNKLWLKDNIPSAAGAQDNVQWNNNANSAAYEYDVSFGVSVTHTNGNSVVWDWLRDRFVTPTQISCGSMAHRQHVPTVIGVQKTDFVLPDVSFNWLEGNTPLGNSQLLTTTTIDVTTYTIGGQSAAFRQALVGFGGTLGAKNPNNNADWTAISLADLGVMSFMSRRGQGLCAWNMRFSYPQGPAWKNLFDTHKNDASVKAFLKALAQRASTAIFSDTLDYNDNVNPPEIQVFKSPIFYVPTSAKLWPTNSNPKVAISLEGDAELPAYYVTGKGIESASSRAFYMAQAMIGRVVRQNGDSVAASITNKNDWNKEYSLQQACKYLAEMTYFKTGASISATTARNLYTDCPNPANNWQCRCLSSANILHHFLQQSQVQYANV